MEYNKEDMQVLNMVSQRKTVTEQYSDGLDSSFKKPKISYNKKKKQKLEKVKKAIVTIALVGATFIAAVSYNSMIVKASKDVDNNGIISLFEDEIDKKVNEYIKIMNSNADKHTRIETAYGRNTDNTDTNVDYTDENIENLANHFINAGNVSEIELRCAILAAYKVINEPYRESIINRGIIRARQKEQEDPILNSVNPTLGNNIEQLLKNLGHDSIKDYHKNERQDIKDLASQPHTYNNGK